MNVHAPVVDYGLAREAMVDSQLKPSGVNDPDVVAAMQAVERETFVPETVRSLAYIDSPIPIAGGRFLPPATAIGLLLTQLAPKAGERGLVIGCGSGYSLAVLKRMGIEAIGVESAPELAAAARKRGFDVVEGPLVEGHARGAPYDLILIDGAVETIPDALIAQLRDGGQFGTALIDGGVSRLVVGRKAAGTYGFYSIADWAVPALPGFERPRTFAF